jgi:hypothetical protein
MYLDVQVKKKKEKIRKPLSTNIFASLSMIKKLHSSSFGDGDDDDDEGRVILLLLFLFSLLLLTIC